MVTGVPPLPAWMRATGLPQAWHGQPAWRVLDTDFGDGTRLAQLWRLWADDPLACRLLHLVCFSAKPPHTVAVLRALHAHGIDADKQTALQEQWFGLLPGLHRLVLHDGRLQLTVCVGPTLALLREQQFLADTIVVGPSSDRSRETASGAGPGPWDAWALKALARLCRRGSRMAVAPGCGLEPAALAATGWRADDPPPAPADAAARPPWSGSFDPPWQIKQSRMRWAQPPASVSHCVVIGAGLAGAAVAAALARRGWQVTVLDGASEPGAGASGLPVGLFAPQFSRDDGPRARLSRAGIRATLQAARRVALRQGQDWDCGGVARIDTPPAALPPDWPAAARDWARPATEPLAMLARPAQALWHAAAGWIKPRQLVLAWLAQPGIRFQGRSSVQAIALADGRWQLLGPDGRLLAEAPQLVIACAGASATLLHQAVAAAGGDLPPQAFALAPVHGQISWALHDAADAACFPPFPVNGAGSVAAHIPWAGGTAWFAGATYEAPDASALSAAQAHAHNLARLAQLLPEAARAVAPALARGAVTAWRGTRWNVADRMPVAGAWPLPAQPHGSRPGLWLSTAMGSRGLTHAALCGEWIAAQLGAEPRPLDAALQRCIDVRRLAARAAAA